MRVGEVCDHGVSRLIFPLKQSNLISVFFSFMICVRKDIKDAKENFPVNTEWFFSILYALIHTLKIFAITWQGVHIMAP